MAASGSARLGWHCVWRGAKCATAFPASEFSSCALCWAFPPFRLSGRCRRQWWRAWRRRAGHFGRRYGFSSRPSRGVDTELAWLDGQADLSRMATMRAMVRHEQATLLVEAKAVTISIRFTARWRWPRVALAPALAAEETASGKIYGAVAEGGLFDRLDIAPGAIVQVGDIRVRLNDRISHEPDRSAGGFPLAPRLLLGFEGLRAAGLLQPGSLINFHYRLKLPPENACPHGGNCARGRKHISQCRLAHSRPV